MTRLRRLDKSVAQPEAERISLFTAAAWPRLILPTGNNSRETTRATALQNTSLKHSS